ncbi:putative ABC-type transport system involved in lysophospholipase L1 biosynthesis, permease component [Burkholderiales bacterium JOSHI_001]|nr:putative ABC-type transport system involved in lysophospholipase L1 biosynthesis, permease component [Burkholderiales bacterium JOSHI_001]
MLAPASASAAAARVPLIALLRALSLPEWRHHPWRHGAAALAVALGVALAFSVQLINTSALAEFSGAVRSANGEPDLTLAARTRDGFDDALFDTVRTARGVSEASPVVELDSYARRTTAPARHAVRLLGVDALRVAAVAPALLPRPASAPATDSDARAGLSVLNPNHVFANPAALQQLAVQVGDELSVQSTQGWQAFRVAGTVAVAGPALLVLDIAAAQARFGMAGRLTRIDLRLAAGMPRDALWPALPLTPGQRAQLLPQAPDDAAQRVSNLSRAYRVNLTVLALVALLVGAFLVWSVVSLSVAQRTPAFALLGVLGLGARERRRLVLAEAALLGLAGSAVGLAAGTALAWAALRALGGDLGGGYFPGVQPTLQFSGPAALAYAALGTAAAMAGAWGPARSAQALPPAQALKGLGAASRQAPRALVASALALLAAGVALALLPPLDGLPLAAYASVAALLAGGVVLVPGVVGALLAAVHPRRHALALLAVERARFARHTASAAVAGVVASLALCVALTVMVASFRDAVTQWLDSVLPADLYARSAATAAASQQAVLPEALLQQATRLPGVLKVQTTRVLSLALHPQRPAVALLARPIDAQSPEQTLPLLDAPQAARAGEVAVFISEPMALLYELKAGDTLVLPLASGALTTRVRGVWRDYARQFGAVAIDQADYQRATGDLRHNDLALWLAPGTDPAAVTGALRRLAGDATPLDVMATGDLRRLSLAIFDRSFAVTRYLQFVAIGVGLVGVAASLSAQVLARRKEFGLLAHLGLSRRQVLLIVCGEALAWLAAGVLLGLVLGVALSVVLVKVVNPQSFHWRMDLVLPAAPLAALAAAVLGLGLATAALAGRRAAGASAVLAVKEDW